MFSSWQKKPTNTVPDTSRDNLELLLNDKFGFDGFRGEQYSVVKALIEGRDAFVLWATGSGKSLCYLFPAAATNKVSFVVSPLVALMHDQCNFINNNTALRAVSLSAGASGDKFSAAISGNCDIVFLTPERCSTWLGNLKSLEKKNKIGLFAIDEAHCVSEFGHDFRPDYRTLDRIRDMFPNTPLAALTATATSVVKKDIIKNLKLRDPCISQTTFNRPNLSYVCRRKSNMRDDLLSVLGDYTNAEQKPAGVAIIYTTRRADVEDIVNILGKYVPGGIVGYHAGMSPAARNSAHEAFIHDRCSVLVATVAFGMGIDKGNIRMVIHYGTTKSIETYYQQTGRAGRDGLASECICFYSDADFSKASRLVESSWSDHTRKNVDYVTHCRKLLSQIKHYATASRTCRRQMLLNYFDEQFQPPCNNCDNCCNKENQKTINMSKELWLLLKTMKCTGTYGLTMFRDILMGSRQKKIMERNLDRRNSETHGLGKTYGAEYWNLFFHQIRELQYIEERQMDSYTVYALTMKGEQFLRQFRDLASAEAQDIPLELSTELAAIIKKKDERAARLAKHGIKSTGGYSSKAKVIAEDILQGLSPEERLLFTAINEHLRTQHSGVKELVQRRASCESEFLAANGCRANHWEKCGPVVIELLDSFCKANNLERDVLIADDNEKLKDQHTGALFKELVKVRAEVAKKKGVAPNVLFSNKYLILISKAKPRTEPQILMRNGVRRMARLHGDDCVPIFLNTVISYCDREMLEITAEATASTENDDTSLGWASSVQKLSDAAIQEMTLVEWPKAIYFTTDKERMKDKPTSRAIESWSIFQTATSLNEAHQTLLGRGFKCKKPNNMVNPILEGSLYIPIAKANVLRNQIHIFGFPAIDKDLVYKGITQMDQSDLQRLGNIRQYIQEQTGLADEDFKLSYDSIRIHRELFFLELAQGLVKMPKVNPFTLSSAQLKTEFAKAAPVAPPAGGRKRSFGSNAASFGAAAKKPKFGAKKPSFGTKKFGKSSFGSKKFGRG